DVLAQGVVHLDLDRDRAAAVVDLVLVELQYDVVLLLDLEGADVHGSVGDACEASAALVGDDAGGNGSGVAPVDGRAPGQQGHRLGRAAVVGQGCQHGVKRRGDGAGLVGADPAGAAIGLADQVVAEGGDVGIGVGRKTGRIAGDDCVGQRHLEVSSVRDA